MEDYLVLQSDVEMIVNNIDESHIYAEWKKLNTEEYTLYISIYMKF